MAVAAARMLQIKQALSLVGSSQRHNLLLSKESSSKLFPFAYSLFNRSDYFIRGIQTQTNPTSQAQANNDSLKPVNDAADVPSRISGDDSPAKHTVISNLKTSPRHDLAMIYTCKVCETRSVKTVCRESYEKGVVVARCGGCNNFHLLADHLGWFGEPGRVEDLLAARGEEVKKGSVDTLSLTLEDLAGTKVSKD
ncbi:hypothetical protein HS088_TW16G00176 [Tripterygium wilfordii]|uniref:DNL-type domain-containing protein n=1 Tax=Tripterygium wilfordii TaxID=458696 RepID=A0A7J7CI99_TRIWF|nr:DNL-type zinc finger protein [Tripterygium wilfordii]KAF5733736.1 hypothetical protein HS088_TW16G00176 [Tripterygium wilfordii]